MHDDPEPDGPSETLERHKPGLIAQVVELARTQPDQRFVALVAEADAPEAPSLRAAPAGVSRAPDGTVAALVTRESALNMLGAMTPGLLDWLDDEGPGPLRRLPVIHAARRRMRTTSFEYEAPS